MGHWSLKKTDYMGGGVLSENLLLTFDRYIKSNVPVSIKISNHNRPVYLLYEIIQSTFCVKIKQKKVVFVFIDPLLHVKRHCSMQSVKQHYNLQKFPKAASITSSVGLDKKLAIPVITLVSKSDWDE